MLDSLDSLIAEMVALVTGLDGIDKGVKEFHHLASTAYETLLEDGRKACLKLEKQQQHHHQGPNKEEKSRWGGGGGAGSSKEEGSVHSQCLQQQQQQKSKLNGTIFRHLYTTFATIRKEGNLVRNYLTGHRPAWAEFLDLINNQAVEKPSKNRLLYLLSSDREKKAEATVSEVAEIKEKLDQIVTEWRLLACKVEILGGIKLKDVSRMSEGKRDGESRLDSDGKGSFLSRREVVIPNEEAFKSCYLQRERGLMREV